MKSKYFNLFLIVSIVLWVFLNLMFGKIQIPLNELWQVLFHSNPENEIYQNLIFSYRLNKIVTAILVGVSLPISGYLLQDLFQNPLAGPSVLGISSFSSLGVAIVIFMLSFFASSSWYSNVWILILAALAGALLALVLLSFFMLKLSSNASIIIVGFMLSGFAAALIEMMQFFAPSEQVKSYLIWGLGSITNLSWFQILVFSIGSFLGIIVGFLSLRGLKGLQIGELYAYSMGINVKKTRVLVLLSSAILTAFTTAFVGPIAFIGLIVPYLVKIVLPFTDKYLQFFSVILLGVSLMLFFAFLTEIFPWATLPINILTSLFGAPIVISILFKFKNQA